LDPCEEKLEMKLNYWYGKNLFIWGRTILINTSIFSILLYILFFYRIHVGKERILVNTDLVSSGVRRKIGKDHLVRSKTHFVTKGPGWFRSARLGGYEHLFALQMALEKF
jgi:hypothetical protein